MPKKNRNVVLLSTWHAEADVSDREDKKPIIALDYNRNKGGVDNLDKVIGTYSCRRMTARWPLVVFHNIIDVSSYNSFMIWREICPDWMPGKRNKRRVFLQELGKALVTPFIAQRQCTPRTEASAAVVKAVKATTTAAQRALYPGGARPKHPASIALAAAAPFGVRGVRCAQGKRTVKLTPCAAGVTNTSARAAHWSFALRVHSNMRWAMRGGQQPGEAGTTQGL